MPGNGRGKTSMKNSVLYFIILCFLSGCITNTSVKVDDYLKHSSVVYIRNDSSYEAIYKAKYIPQSINIVVCGQRNVEGDVQDYIYIYDRISHNKTNIFPYLLEKVRNEEKHQVDRIIIKDCFVLNKNHILVSVQIILNEIMGRLDKLLIFDINNCFVYYKDDQFDYFNTKQSLYNRNVFYFIGPENDIYKRTIEFKSNMNEPWIIKDETVLKTDLEDTTKMVLDFCDGNDENSMMLSLQNVQSYNYNLVYNNVIVLYDLVNGTKRKEIILQNSIYHYLNGNNVRINLSTDKRLLLFWSSPFGCWMYNMDKSTFFTICNTKFNWYSGFPNINVEFADWSWEDNRILLIFENYQHEDQTDGLYEIDLDLFD